MRPVLFTVPTVIVAVAVGLSGCAGAVPRQGVEMDAGHPAPGAGTSTEPGASPASEAVSAAANAITAALDGRAEFGSVSVDDTGNGLALYWYGSAPAQELAALAADHPAVPVQVRPTDYRPGGLREAARRLVQAEAGVGAAIPHPDGSGITVEVDLSQIDESVDALAARLTTETGFPVDVGTSPPVPAN
jgi:hypothetical protein